MVDVEVLIKDKEGYTKIEQIRKGKGPIYLPDI